MQNKLSLQTLAEQASKLFSLPDIIIRLQQLIDSDTSSADQIAEIISYDPALTARLLRLANSSFYSFPAQIDTVCRATMVVGTNEIYNLALATAAVGAFRSVNKVGIDIDLFWHRSVYAGLVAKSLLEQSGTRKTESIFVTGLLHHIGLLVVAEREADVTTQLLMPEPVMPPWEREKILFGFTLARCGYQLMLEWNLPESLYEPVLWQHQPEHCPTANQHNAGCIHIAIRAAAAKMCQNGFDYFGSINADAWGLAGVDEENLKQAQNYADENVMQILLILSPESTA